MNRTHIVALAAAVLLAASVAAAEVQTREIEYKEGETVLQGLIAWDDASKGLRPGVLVVHEWWGHNEHARYQAKRLAEAGYVGFALDMYGKGKVTTHPQDAQGFMNEGAAAALCAPRQRGAGSEPRSRATTINVKNGPGNRRIDGRRTALVWISQTASRQLLESSRPSMSRSLFSAC